MSRLVTTALVLLATTGVATERPEGGSSRKQKQVRIAGVVLKWIRADKEANFRRAEALIREAAAGGAQIVCTTECFLDGYAIADKSIPLDKYRALGEPIPEGPDYKRLAALARELKILLVAGLLEADGENRCNTVVLISPEGRLLGKYRKQHLEHELVRNRPGTESPVFDTPYGRIGVLICADRRLPEIAGKLKKQGADFLLCPSGGMFGPKSNDPILQARSRETHLPIVFVHPAEFLVTGPDGSILDRTILGNSLLIAPAEIGTPKDQNRIFYYDLPGASDKAAGHTLGDGAVVRDVWAGHFDLLKVRIQQSREAIAASLRQPGARPVTVAVWQMRNDCGGEAGKQENLRRMIAAIAQAAGEGVQILALPEMCLPGYFTSSAGTPAEATRVNHALADPPSQSAAIQRLREAARDKRMVVAFGFCEREADKYYNAIGVIDADGKWLGTRRKNPLSPGPYDLESFTEPPSDQRCAVFRTRYATVGVSNCFDGEFPESIRRMRLAGAELLLWCNAATGNVTTGHSNRIHHSASYAQANQMWVACCNAVGKELRHQRDCGTPG
jgi:predicted amidohydrolase